MTKYLAVITKGDDVIKEGDSFFINECQIKNVLNKGYMDYQLIENNRIYKSSNTYYPCKVVKQEYKLISEETLARSVLDDINVKYNARESDYDWKDHWC